MNDWVSCLSFLGLCGVSMAHSAWLGRLSRRFRDHEIRCHRIRKETCGFCGGNGCPFNGKQSSMNDAEYPLNPAGSRMATTEGSEVRKANELSLGRRSYPGNETDTSLTRGNDDT